MFFNNYQNTCTGPYSVIFILQITKLPYKARVAVMMIRREIQNEEEVQNSLCDIVSRHSVNLCWYVGKYKRMYTAEDQTNIAAENKCF